MGGSVQVLELAKSKFGRDRVLCRSAKQPEPGRWHLVGILGRGKGIDPGRRSWRGPGAVGDQITVVC